MRAMVYLVSVCLFSALLVQSCKVDSQHEQAQIPPSIIYADDDSTVLRYYSNVGEKGPNLAPYFCSSLKKDLAKLLTQEDSLGNFIYHKKNGKCYNIYEDELKIYTTINSQMQEHAEAAVRKHLSEDLQPAFTENNSSVKRFPFSNTYNGRKVSDETIQNILNRAKKSSDRYRNMTVAEFSTSEIETSFEVPRNMKVFSWKGDIDTVMTPNDSILYYKNYIRSGLISIEPSSGHVKAWVGGIDFDHFSFDHVKQGKRQIGSAMKPFTYVAAFSMGVIEPCMELNQEVYCVDPCDPTGRRWCPSGTPSKSLKSQFSQRSGGTGVPVIALMGACSGPQTVAKILKRMNIDIPEDQVVPSMCLGTPDMSLYNATAAYATFANDGNYVAPQTIRRIEDKHGNVIYSSQPVSSRVFYNIFSYDVLQMMKMVVTSGTSTSLRWHKKWGGIEQPTAGKTGTTQGNSDNWFFGLTPDLVTGVWSGAEDKQVRFRSMTWGQGARAALPIYGYYMQSIYADSTINISTSDFEAPLTYDPSRFDCDEEKNGEPNPFGLRP